MKKFIKHKLIEANSVNDKVNSTEIIFEIEKIIKLASKSILSGGKIIFCGNGGSASDSMHLAAELIGRFKKNRKPIPSVSLNSEISTITAIANDYGFENVFSRQIDALGTNADTLIAISTSGNSKNIIKCIKAANHLGMESILLTGKSESEASENSKLSIHADSSFPGIIQQSHITIGQLICWNIDQFID